MMELKIRPYIVYVKTDDKNRIIAINSNKYISDPSEWIEIASGFGDKYHHAQSCYLNKPIMDARGVWRYMLVDGKPVERTQEEMDADWEEPVPEPDPKDQKIAELEEKLAAISATILNI